MISSLEFSNLYKLYDVLDKNKNSKFASCTQMHKFIILEKNIYPNNIISKIAAVTKLTRKLEPVMKKESMSKIKIDTKSTVYWYAEIDKYNLVYKLFSISCHDLSFICSEFNFT